MLVCLRPVQEQTACTMDAGHNNNLRFAAFSGWISQICMYKAHEFDKLDTSDTDWHQQSQDVSL